MIHKILIINRADNYLRKLLKICTPVSYTAMLNTPVSGWRNNYIIVLICTWLLILSDWLTKHIHNEKER